jgi:uncharacterized protein YllA (UPF0747 family)
MPEMKNGNCASSHPNSAGRRDNAGHLYRMTNSHFVLSDQIRQKDLPEIPKIWVDFLDSRLPLKPSKGAIAEMPSCIDAGKNKNGDLIHFLAKRKTSSTKISESIERLRMPASVAVVVNINAGLFGGPASQILKCLTAIKICGELANHSVNAVPVMWIVNPPPDFPEQSVQLIDGAGELHAIRITPGGNPATIIKEIEKFGDGKFDTEILRLLETEFLPETAVSSACARLFENFFNDWGMIVLDPAEPALQRIIAGAWETCRAGYGVRLPERLVPTFLLRNIVLPASIFVIGADEVNQLISELPLFSAFKLAVPTVVPQAGATIVDGKSRRILNKYKIDFLRLFAGEDEVRSIIRNSIPDAIPEKIERIKTEVERKIEDLKTLIPAGKQFIKTADSAGKKIAYQFEKIQNSFESAVMVKEGIVQRQVRHTCQRLSPCGRLQENELAGIQFPLIHSKAAFRMIYEKLDIHTFEHQLIFLD